MTPTAPSRTVATVAPPAKPVARTPVPRWVKVFGIIAIVLVVLFAILHFAGLNPLTHTP